MPQAAGLCVAGSYPDMVAFQEVVGVLNMLHLWRLYTEQLTADRSIFPKKRQVLLASLAWVNGRNCSAML